MRMSTQITTVLVPALIFACALPALGGLFLPA